MEYTGIIAGGLIVILTFAIDLVHGKIKTGTVDSITDSLGKLLLGTALTLAASLLLNGTAVPSETFALIVVLMITVILLLYQAHSYSAQREQTKLYLKELVNEKRIQARMGPSPGSGAPKDNSV